MPWRAAHRLSKMVPTVLLWLLAIMASGNHGVDAERADGAAGSAAADGAAGSIAVDGAAGSMQMVS